MYTHLYIYIYIGVYMIYIYIYIYIYTYICRPSSRNFQVPDFEREPRVCSTAGAPNDFKAPSLGYMLPDCGQFSTKTSPTVSRTPRG